MKRNFEPWREAKLAEETEEERLDRLEREEAEHDAMAELEGKTLDAKTEMAIADKLDEIRTRNARMERADRGDVDGVENAMGKMQGERDEEKERVEREDEEAAKAAFRTGTGEKVRRLAEEEEDVDGAKPEVGSWGEPEKDDARLEGLAPEPTFVRKKKRKRDIGAALGIKKKKPTMALV